MNVLPDPAFDWPAIETRLEREKKADLIYLIQELTAVSPAVQQFLHARYLHRRNTVTRVQPYRRRIISQFQVGEVWPDFQQIAQIIQEYQSAAGVEPKGLAELYVSALEAAANFVDGIGIHDVDFFSDLTAFAWQCVSHFNDFPALYSPYVVRLRAAVSKLAQCHWDNLMEPFYQLELDMSHDEGLL
jgi:hypothetical protein